MIVRLLACFLCFDVMNELEIIALRFRGDSSLMELQPWVLGNGG